MARVAKAAPADSPSERQPDLFGVGVVEAASRPPPSGQLIKWVGSKHRFAARICAILPRDLRRYHEPFVGSAAVAGALAPADAVAGDALPQLIAIWQTLQRDPDGLVAAYRVRWRDFARAADAGRKTEVYLALRARYNANRDPLDLLFLVRACYGGVVRFARDGSMNTPCGSHRPIDPDLFAVRAAAWRERLRGVRFVHADFETVIDAAGPDDVVYCDPPYADSQNALYGAQTFDLDRLFRAIARARDRGARIALSIDGTKRSGRRDCAVAVPPGLFAADLPVRVGRSMLRRFQMAGQTLEGEVVADRLLLTWAPDPAALEQFAKTA